MKKFLLSASVLGLFTLYSLRIKLGGDENPVVAIKTIAPSTAPQIPVVTPAVSNGPTPGRMGNGMGPPMMQKYKDGTYTGDVADAFYGNIQVQVVIMGGKITDVIFLQYPNDRPNSIAINTQAMPMLKQEAIQAQSAQVDAISGATASSDAFVQSLQSALQKAG